MSFLRAARVIANTHNVIRIAIVVVFYLFTLQLVDVSNLGNHPFSNSDYVWHFYHFFLARHAEFTWVDYSHYSPFFMAGYPVLYPPSNGLFTIILRFFPNIHLTPFFNGVVLATIITTPLVFWASLRYTRLCSDGKDLLFFFCLTIYLLKTFFFVNIGMFSYALLTALWFLTMVYIADVIDRKSDRVRDISIVALLTGVAVLLHQYAAILLFPSILLLFLSQLARPKHLLINVLVFAAITGALNLSWVYPYFAYSDWRTSEVWSRIGSEFGGMLGHETRKNASYYTTLLFIPVTLICMILCAKFTKLSRRILGYFLTVYLYPTLLGLYGPLVGIPFIFEPIRMRELGIYVAAILIAHVLSDSPRPAWLRRLLQSRVYLPLMLISFVAFALFSLDKRYSGMGPNEIEELDVGKMASFLSENGVSNDGRVLIEARTIRREEIHDKSITETEHRSMLPLLLGTEVIGGPYEIFRSVNNNFTDFSTGYVFHKPIEKHDIENFKKHLDLYNVHWVVPLTRKSTDYIAAHEQHFQHVATTAEIYSDPVSLYRVRSSAKPSYFIEGDGVIEAKVDKLSLFEVKGTTVILKYHWFDTVRSATPRVTLEPVLQLDDPVPFIKVNNPEGLKEIVISF